MTVEEITKKYLKENGYGGLVSNFGCSCEIDNLFIFDDHCLKCTPGYKISDGDYYKIIIEKPE